MKDGLYNKIPVSYFHGSNELMFLLFFFFFFWSCPLLAEVPGPGISNLCHSSDLSHDSDNTRSFNL